MEKKALLVLVLSIAVFTAIVSPLQASTERDARYNVRETWMLQERMFVSHLELDKLILSPDGNKVFQIDHYNFDGMVIPTDDWQGLGIIRLGYNGAIGYKFNSGEILWVGAIVMDQHAVGTYQIALAVPTKDAKKLLANIPNIVAVGVKANDGTEHWAPARYTKVKKGG